MAYFLYDTVLNSLVDSKEYKEACEREEKAMEKWKFTLGLYSRDEDNPAYREVCAATDAKLEVLGTVLAKLDPDVVQSLQIISEMEAAKADQAYQKARQNRQEVEQAYQEAEQDSRCAYMKVLCVETIEKLEKLEKTLSTLEDIRQTEEETAIVEWLDELEESIASLRQTVDVLSKNLVVLRKLLV